MQVCHFIRLTSLAIKLMIVPGFVSSITAAELDHLPLEKNNHLTYAEVFSSAREVAPESLSASSRQDQAQQYGQLGESLYVGRPQLQTSFIDDAPLSGVGLMELEASMNFMLWRPGERRQAQALGSNYDKLFAAWQQNLELEVAGRVRQVLANLHLAESMLRLENEALSAAEELVVLTTALLDSGAIPQLDVMQSRSLMLEQQTRVYEAEASLVDAEREYTVYTGLTIRPGEEYVEKQSSLDEISQDHPLLRYLQANIDVAGSSVQNIRRQAAGSPTLGVGFRRERGMSGQDYIDTMGVSLNIPLGKSPMVSTQVSNARRQQADLMVARQQAYIRLNQALHEAEHEIYVTRQQLEVNSSQLELSQARVNMARTAYELGETDFLQVTLALQQLHTARKDLENLNQRLVRMILEYNQSLGVLP